MITLLPYCFYPAAVLQPENAAKCHLKKEPAHADKPRTPITIIRLEGLKCQEESAGMVQTQCNAGVMRSTALSGSGLKNYKADAEPGYIPLKS
jgi:hypothetical protein